MRARSRCGPCLKWEIDSSSVVEVPEYVCSGGCLPPKGMEGGKEGKRLRNPFVPALLNLSLISLAGSFEMVMQSIKISLGSHFSLYIFRRVVFKFT